MQYITKQTLIPVLVGLLVSAHVYPGGDGSKMLIGPSSRSAQKLVNAGSNYILKNVSSREAAIGGAALGFGVLATGVLMKRQLAKQKHKYESAMSGYGERDFEYATQLQLLKDASSHDQEMRMTLENAMRDEGILGEEEELDANKIEKVIQESTELIQSIEAIAQERTELIQSIEAIAQENVEIMQMYVESEESNLRSLKSRNHDIEQLMNKNDKRVSQT